MYDPLNDTDTVGDTMYSASANTEYDIWRVLEAVYRGCKAESEAEHMAD